MLVRVQNGLRWEVFRVDFYDFINPTEVDKSWKFSSGENPIVGGSSLDHFISIELRRKEQIKKLIESLVMGNEKYKSSEIKVYEGSFQIVSKGLIP